MNTNVDLVSETKLVKKAIQALGYNAKVKHGAGSTWAWLEVSVNANYSEELARQVRLTTETASGRNEHGRSQISIRFDHN